MDEIHTLKTTCCYTGRSLDDEQEVKLKDVKKRLFKKAIETHKTISLCKHSFQIHDEHLLFWFNVEGNTKLLKESITN